VPKYGLVLDTQPYSEGGQLAGALSPPKMLKPMYMIQEPEKLGW